MIRLLHDKHPIPSFSQILRTNSTSTSTSDDYNICLDELGLVAWRKLEERVIVSLAGFQAGRHSGDSKNPAESGCDFDPGLL